MDGFWLPMEDYFMILPAQNIQTMFLPCFMPNFVEETKRSEIALMV